MLRPGMVRKYALVSLGISVVLLAVGLALKPSQPEAKSTSSEGEIAGIQRLTEQRRRRDLSSHLADGASADERTYPFGRAADRCAQRRFSCEGDIAAELLA